jgi:uncharacterized protein (TIGR02996 family)
MLHEEQRRLFLRDVKDRPDDDIPRLILADWLQDMGDPRGEFVHLQVMRTRLAEDNPAAAEMKKRERQLLRKHAFDWLGPLADFGSRWTFERGLIHLAAPLERFGKDAGFPGIESFEWVESLTVSINRPTPLDGLVASGVLRCLVALELPGMFRMPLQPLLHEDLLSLRSLCLAGIRFGDAQARKLVYCPHVAGLNTLDLGWNDLHDEAAVALANSPYLDNLNRLDVRGNRFTAQGETTLRAAFGDRVILWRRGS